MYKVNGDLGVTRDGASAGASCERPITKAGVFLWGWSDPADKKSPFDPSYSHPYVQLLTSYDEGRIGENYKCYGLPKGSIDAGESSLEGALRETEEETGISFKRLMGDDNLKKFINGECLENIDTGYKGVRIRRADPNYGGRSHLCLRTWKKPPHSLLRD
jgi:8-oxo-dGTP pyrophosphatase MutT (NUDIX family)